MADSVINQQTVNAGKDVEKREILLMGMQTDAATMESSMQFPQKVKKELPFDPAIPLLGIYSKNPKSPIQKNLCIPMFTGALLTIATCWKQPKCPSVDE